MELSLFYSIFIFCILTLATGKRIHYEFNVKYTSGAPDGVSKTKILSVNGLFPGPTIEAQVGDILEVVVHNRIQDGQNVSIHWHGIYHRNKPFEDGASYVTQCPLIGGQSQTYVFELEQSGTYWYHSHVMSQYTEGLWGALIIRNTHELYRYDGEILIAVNDWYHRTAHENELWYISLLSHGNPPYPDSALLNGRGRYPCDLAIKRFRNCSSEDQRRHIFRVDPNKKYRVRVINTGSDSAFRFSIDGHNLQTIEVDGVDVLKPVEADIAIISQAQRYSFLIETKGDLDEYLIRADIMTEVIMIIERENINPYPEALLPNITAVLKYRRPSDDPLLEHLLTEHHDWRAIVPPSGLIDPVYLDEHLLQPADRIDAPGFFDTEFTLQANFTYTEDGIRRATFNGTPYSHPDFPTLMSIMIDEPAPPRTIPLYVQYGDVVQIIVNNPFYGPHPFHLHGHHFWVLGTGEQFDGDYNPTRHDLRLNGVRRDTFVVQQLSWGVIRFVADNPGVWLFHCHNDWHNIMGMVATLIEAPEVLRQNYTFPSESIRVCKMQGIDLPIVMKP